MGVQQQTAQPNPHNLPPISPEAPFLGAAATAAYSNKDNAFASNDYLIAQQIALHKQMQ